MAIKYMYAGAEKFRTLDEMHNDTTYAISLSAQTVYDCWLEGNRTSLYAVVRNGANDGWSTTMCHCIDDEGAWVSLSTFHDDGFSIGAQQETFVRNVETLEESSAYYVVANADDEFENDMFYISATGEWLSEHELSESSFEEANLFNICVNKESTPYVSKLNNRMALMQVLHLTSAEAQAIAENAPAVVYHNLRTMREISNKIDALNQYLLDRNLSPEGLYSLIRGENV